MFELRMFCFRGRTRGSESSKFVHGAEVWYATIVEVRNLQVHVRRKTIPETSRLGVIEKHGNLQSLPPSFHDVNHGDFEVTSSRPRPTASHISLTKDLLRMQFFFKFLRLYSLLFVKGLLVFCQKKA